MLENESNEESKKILPLSHTKHEELKHLPFNHEEEFSQAIVDDFLEILSDIIEYPIDNETVETEEKAGGDFVADIICEIEGSDVEDGTRKKIIIENQFEDSDHKHLGQCVTYAANKDARIVIWICERFREPHVDALRWLNEKFSGELGFYGLEVTAYKGEDFADGNPRMDFKVVEKPHLEGKILVEEAWKKIRWDLFCKTKERFNVIAKTKTNRGGKPKWRQLHLDRFSEFIDFYWQHFQGGNGMACNAKCRTGKKSGVKTIDDENTWRILNENKEMIEKRLPDIEWRPAGKHQDKYSLRINVPMNEGLENLSSERFNEITEKLASDMKILVEIVKDLKL